MHVPNDLMVDCVIQCDFTFKKKTPSIQFYSPISSALLFFLSIAQLWMSYSLNESIFFAFKYIRISGLTTANIIDSSRGTKKKETPKIIHCWRFLKFDFGWSGHASSRQYTSIGNKIFCKIWWSIFCFSNYPVYFVFSPYAFGMNWILSPNFSMGTEWIV